MATARKFDTSPPPPSPPTLKLYDPELRGSRPPLRSESQSARPEPAPAPQAPAEPSHPKGLTPATRFSEFYRAYAEPSVLIGLRTADAKTLEQYRGMVTRFRELCGDPPLEEITDATCVAFRDRLLSRPGRTGTASPNTVRKILRHFRCVLRTADARHSHHNPDGIDKHGLFGFDEDGDRRTAPRVVMPREVVREPRPIAIEHVAAILDACSAMHLPLLLPEGIDPPAWWRAIWIWQWNVGTRIETCLAARWSWIRDGNWLHVPSAHFKGGQREVRIYLNRFALAAAETIRVGGGDRIFPLPTTTNRFHTLTRRLMGAAGLPQSEDFGGTHRCRKSLDTWLTERNPAVAKLQLGHIGGDVGLKHYAAKSVVKRLLERVPQPACRIPIADPRLQKDQPGQRLLF